MIVGAGLGGGPHVKVYDGAQLLQGNAVELASFFAFDPGFSGGVYVAGGNITTSSRAQVIVGAGFGGGLHVRVFGISGGTVMPIAGPLASFFAYPTSSVGFGSPPPTSPAPCPRSSPPRDPAGGPT